MILYREARAYRFGILKHTWFTRGLRESEGVAIPIGFGGRSEFVMMIGQRCLMDGARGRMLVRDEDILCRFYSRRFSLFLGMS